MTDAVEQVKHTKGPWNARPDSRDIYKITVYDGNCVPMCDVSRGVNQDWITGNLYAGGVAEANARLIAAAPDLLEACERALQLSGAWREAIAMLEDFGVGEVRLKNMMAALDLLDMWRKQARAAIERAQP